MPPGARTSACRRPHNSRWDGGRLGPDAQAGGDRAGAAADSDARNHPGSDTGDRAARADSAARTHRDSDARTHPDSDAASDPRPTPAPTATPPPVPSGRVATAPNLVGQHRSDAHRLWTAAGFTGDVTALAGQGNYVIASQDRTPGASYPCDTEVTIGP